MKFIPIFCLRIPDEGYSNLCLRIPDESYSNRLTEDT
jgi:hypothetical protein